MAMDGIAARKTGIRRKITVLICVAVIIVIFVAGALIYFVGFNTIRDGIGQSRAQMALVLGENLAHEFSGEVEDAKTYAGRLLWIEAVKASNAQYDGIDESAIKRRMADMDEKWIAAGSDDPMVKGYLENKAASSIGNIVKTRKNVAEIFITDKFGGLVAASNKTSDFYQADEGWWQAAWDAGNGKVCVGAVEFDESSAKWTMPIAVPIKDETGKVIGILKESLAIVRLFGPIQYFSIGNTGRAVLLGRKGTALVHYNKEPNTVKPYDQNELTGLLSRGKSYAVTDKSVLHPDRRMLIGFAVTTIPFAEKSEGVWTVLIEQDASEALAPMKGYIVPFLLFFIVSILVMMPVGYLFGGIFTRPIHELHLATEKVIAGDWDARIEVHTGDEIEQFADAFREMVANVKDKQKKILKARNELEAQAMSLEEKVKERTRDLTRAQDATLNILEDLTSAKKNLEENASKLEQALIIKAEFTSTVSHELRTPLAAIKEGIAIVLDGTSGSLNKEQKEFLEMARRNVDRLTRLITDLLDFQKLEAGKIKLNIEKHDISKLAKDVAGSMAALASQKDLEIIVDTEDGLPPAACDKDRIIQVMTNIVSNAIGFTEKGQVRIGISRDGDYIKVSVKDAGPGIGKDDLPKLFHQFTQINTGISRKVGGTGLGLAISKDIVEDHGGKIWAESGPGKGSIFYFTLPIERRSR